MTSISAQEFLCLVWPSRLLTNETLELRLRRRSDNTIKREFIPTIHEFVEKANQYSSTFDVYFALATRFGRVSGTKRDCYRICTAWADIDNRSIEECAFKPKPDIIVQSGGGLHVYWRLDHSWLMRGEEERWKPLESVNRALAERFKGDRNTIDVTRVLRVPGTLNHKFSPAREVKAYVV